MRATNNRPLTAEEKRKRNDGNRVAIAALLVVVWLYFCFDYRLAFVVHFVTH